MSATVGTSTLVPICHFLLRVDSTESGDTTVFHANTGDGSNSEMDTGGRFVPIVDLTSKDYDTNSHMSDIPLQLPASAHVASDISGVVAFATSCNLMWNIPSLHPIPSEIGLNPWQLQYLCAYHQGSLAGSWTARKCSCGYTAGTRSSE